LDLPVWQELREELFPRGLEVVTVALDLRGVETAGRWIEAAAPRHPALIDRAHVVDELFGIVNVPSGVWIDEGGTIVRPPEPAFPKRAAFLGAPVPDNLDPYQAEVLREARRIRVEPERYVAALRDWVELGAASRFALAPGEVLRRSGERGEDQSRAAAHFELAQHLWREGREAEAVPHFRAARRLQPANWTYKRQAWVLANRFQAPSDVFEGDWLSDVREIGAENYYPKLEM
jgi:hypothetical protein